MAKNIADRHAKGVKPSTYTPKRDDEHPGPLGVDPFIRHPVWKNERNTSARNSLHRLQRSEIQADVPFFPCDRPR